MELKAAPKNLIYFQNMVPGTMDSPVVKQFREQCLAEEKDERQKESRELMLNNFPPILAFLDYDEAKKFYGKAAKNCNFCCGDLQDPNKYMFSMASGSLYEGGAEEIEAKVSKDIKSLSLGDPALNGRINGLNEFKTKVAERNQENKENTQFAQEADQHQANVVNPLRITPKKPGE